MLRLIKVADKDKISELNDGFQWRIKKEALADQFPGYSIF